MDIFAQKKMLVRTVIVLAALNLCSIGVFVWKVLMPPPKPQTEAPENQRDVSGILERELNLTRDQVDRIRDLRADFAQKERHLVDERDSMNAEMFNITTREELIRSLAREIADNEYNMEMLRFDQATKLKSVCTPEQAEKFGKLVREMRDLFKPDEKPAREKKKGPPKRDDQNR